MSRRQLSWLENPDFADEINIYQEEIKNQEWTKDNVKDQLQYELTKVFVRVLEDAGVFKLDEKGKKYFIEFIEEAIEGEESFKSANFIP